MTGASATISSTWLLHRRTPSADPWWMSRSGRRPDTHIPRRHRQASRACSVIHRQHLHRGCLYAADEINPRRPPRALRPARPNHLAHPRARCPPRFDANLARPTKHPASRGTQVSSQWGSTSGRAKRPTWGPVDGVSGPEHQQPLGRLGLQDKRGRRRNRSSRALRAGQAARGRVGAGRPHG